MDNLEGWSYPLMPLPPGTPVLLLGDVPVVLFLAFLFRRHNALAKGYEQAGNLSRHELHTYKARLYRNFLVGSGLFTGGCFLIWFTGLALPGAVAAGPVGGVIAVFGFLPYLVWLVPLVAMIADLLITWSSVRR